MQTWSNENSIVVHANYKSVNVHRVTWECITSRNSYQQPAGLSQNVLYLTNITTGWKLEALAEYAIRCNYFPLINVPKVIKNQFLSLFKIL